MNVPKYIHYDFVPDVNVDIIKSGPKSSQRAEIYALLPDLDWDKTNSAKIINKEGVTPIMCVIEPGMVRAQQGWEQCRVGLARDYQ